mgnify:FL=1
MRCQTCKYFQPSLIWRSKGLCTKAVHGKAIAVRPNYRCQLWIASETRSLQPEHSAKSESTSLP